MNTQVRFSALIAFAFLLAGCARDGLPGSVRTLSVAQGTRHAPQVFAPAGSVDFASIAESQNARVAAELRNAIANELTHSGRHRPKGSADAEIVIESLRHGLVEVSADTFAVNISGDVTVRSVQPGKADRVVLSRDFAATSDTLRPLAEFEEPARYNEAVRTAVRKIAAELVRGL